MTRRTAASCLAAFVATLGLTACGEDRGPTVTVTGANLTPEEVAAGARARDVIEKMQKDGTMPNLGKLVKPLTPADVELFLKVMPEVRKNAANGGDLAALSKTVEAHGMSVMQWSILQGRVTGAAMGIQTGVAPGTEDDVKVVAPYKDRVMKVLQGD